MGNLSSLGRYFNKYNDNRLLWTQHEEEMLAIVNKKVDTPIWNIQFILSL